ncbi:hypothetical protein [Rubrivirga marina]|uniref:Tyr recombinase domain-containing protein n=1 Tax=Rubrivirga marina TaxID=1196024 RepID=A0A271J170_9BACT|nr:hypothetical protein [Rubrivirga marina]PAP77271.1 hypothetical protein BSZ37_12915 [Rubrivirga marina]
MAEDVSRRPVLVEERGVDDGLQGLEFGVEPLPLRLEAEVARYSILEDRDVWPERTGAFPADRALAPEVFRMIGALDPDSLLGKRDRALLALGAGAALRPSELSRIEADELDLDVTPGRSELRYQLYGGDDTVVLVPGGDVDPAALVSDWVGAAGVEDGPLFRGVDRHGNVSDRPLSPMSIGRVVRRSGEAAGLDPVPGVDVLRWRLSPAVKNS